MAVRKYRTYPDEFKLEPSDLEAARREIKRLKRQLADAEEKREILIKALNIFSRTDKLGTGS